MTKIYLVRHTQVTGNVEKRLTGRVDYEVTEEGKLQVEKLTKYLQNIRFEEVYSSPSTRAIYTVKKIAKQNKLNIQILEELNEMYFGIYDGYKWEEVDRINPSISIIHKKTNEIMQIPNQETTEHVTDRMYKCIKKILNSNKNDKQDKNILICSHGVAIEAFLRKITKVPFVKKREEYSQKNTSINIIKFDEKNGFCLETLNLVKHLEL